MVAMYFDSLAIIIDHTLHLAAFKIELADVFYMAACILLSGPEGKLRFKYFLEGGKYKLTMDNAQVSFPPLYLSEMNVDRPMDLLTIPATL